MLRAVLTIAVLLQVVWTTRSLTPSNMTPGDLKEHSYPISTQVDNRLRSAYLLRVKDLRQPSANSVERIQCLQRHFDAVIEQLQHDETVALEVALQRLEQHRQEKWTPSERDHWLAKLAKQRAQQIARLRVYQQRGLFPQNEYDTQCALPIFVDSDNTACAVGHLMRMSGWEKEVELIARTNNLVYVPDVQAGPIVEWVVESGLTLEEAALVQPGYEGPAPDSTLAELMSGGTIIRGGLRYENFEMVLYSGDRIENQFPEGLDYFPVSYPLYPFIGFNRRDTLTIDPTTIGVAAGSQTYIDPCCGVGLFTQYEDWLFLGKIPDYDAIENYIASTDELSAGRSAMKLGYSFDVSVVNPGVSISGASVRSQPNFHFNGRGYWGLNGDLEVTTFVSGMESSNSSGSFTPLAELDLQWEYDNSFWGEKVAEFEPVQSLRVVTTGYLEGPYVQFAGLSHSFQLIPEPSALLLLSCGLLLLGRERRQPVR
ncbi:hypothetical protein [Adhaeretor mobilis]|uniref:PEP-CTERM protein-sorting domain-containing protein n=1 Tax=Adhaeretor mobilis TaxID=1930276 RepID=A0A517N2U9_9BACT|nr:hypothetical protein [Adhaeretor mobilis]QDT01460.1 hypothetical protein HG15A2_48020 [Adhaeretor mobilis]